MLIPMVIKICAVMANMVTAMAFPVMSQRGTAYEAKCTIFSFKETSNLLLKETLLSTVPYSKYRCMSGVV